MNQGESFDTTRSLPHGHVMAVPQIDRREAPWLIASRRCRERDLIVQRIVRLSWKLAATRLWGTTALREELQATGVEVTAAYAALDWLLARQRPIEKPLTRDEIGAKADRVLIKCKIRKRFELTIEENLFQWRRREDEI